MEDGSGSSAPGWPGLPPRWSSSAKSGVGTAPDGTGRLWFTLSHGILNEVYYPRLDQACLRDLGLIVTAEPGYFSEEKRHARSTLSTVAEGVPSFRLSNRSMDGRYLIEKEVLADPKREVLLQRIRFNALQGSPGDYRLYALLAPHLGNAGAGNNAWCGSYKGRPMLFAQRGGVALALASSRGWLRRSAGYVGASDGWQDLRRHGRMAWSYARADNGNTALTGELPLGAGELVLALGFGDDPESAAHRATASLLDGFDSAAEAYRQAWDAWQRALRPGPQAAQGRDLYRVSTAVLRSHQSQRFPGAMIASLSIPWGFSKGDGDLGGYHLVWPRDMVESAGGLLAVGALADADKALGYLAVTQEADGHWPQNMWLDGRPYWNGIQMDETGFPILLLALALREGALSDARARELWGMARRAAGYLLCNGPVTQQDRWEEDPGYSPFTLAVEVAALYCAADLAGRYEPALRGILLETAQAWDAAIEDRTYVRDSDLARHYGVDGYYVRIAAPDTADGANSSEGYVPIKNRPPGEDRSPASHVLSPDALALVRFGLREADDPRMVSTVKLIDALLKVETPAGPLWRRYNGDGYGEHEDGRPFDGTGRGRPWPLLCAERAHYELAAGRPQVAEALKATLAASASDGGLLPEQVWDGPELPERELSFGRPSGSAMPLVWAHAEYLKLCRSLADGRIFDAPPLPPERGQDPGFTSWRFNQKRRSIPAGRRLRLESLQPTRVRWSADAWATWADLDSRDSGLGLHVADLAVAGLPAGTRIDFTFYWPQAGRWEGADFAVQLTPALAAPARGDA